MPSTRYPFLCRIHARIYTSSHYNFILIQSLISFTSQLHTSTPARLLPYARSLISLAFSLPLLAPGGFVALFNVYSLKL